MFKKNATGVNNHVFAIHQKNKQAMMPSRRNLKLPCIAYSDEMN